jgi:hypothetical protein
VGGGVVYLQYVTVRAATLECPDESNVKTRMEIGRGNKKGCREMNQRLIDMNDAEIDDLADVLALEVTLLEGRPERPTKLGWSIIFANILQEYFDEK